MKFVTVKGLVIIARGVCILLLHLKGGHVRKLIAKGLLKMKRGALNMINKKLIHSYSRAEALADGVLVDVTDLAKEAGFTVPVAISSQVYGGFINPYQVREGRQSRNWVGQDEKGRLWDMLNNLFWTIKARVETGPELVFKTLFGKRLVQLKSVIGPGDGGEPVITIMLPEED